MSRIDPDGSSGSTENHSNKQHHSAHPLPLPPLIPHGNTAYGDWGEEFDSAAPVIADQMFGDTQDIQSQSSERPFQNAASSSGSAQSRRSSTTDDLPHDDKLDDHMQWTRGKPWYKRPDERWLRPFVILLTLGTGMTIAPKVELCTSLVCEEILGIKYGDPQGESLSLFNMLPMPRERPPLSEECKASAQVEAASSLLSLKLSLAMGVLSLLVTGFWGGLSDRKGRTVILRLAVLGLVLGDLTYIAFGLFPQSAIPFGKNLLVICSAVEGLLGGIATLTATHQAYIADVTPSGTRAKVFAYFIGLFFIGVAVGPFLGSLMTKFMQSTIAPFYFAFFAHATYLVFATLFLPESNSPERMQKAREEYKEKISQLEQASSASSLSHFWRFLFFVSTPIQPLALILPRYRKESITEDSHPTSSHISVSHTQRQKLDWNLTLIALAYVTEAFTYGVLNPKMNYAMLKYGWGKEEIGYFLSFSSFVRAACLMFICPAAIKWFHRPPTSSVLPQDGQSAAVDGTQESSDVEASERTPLLDDEGRSYSYVSETNSPAEEAQAIDDEDFRLDPSSKQVERLWMLRAKHLRQIHDSHFDRKLVLVSIGAASLIYLVLALTARGRPACFVFFSALVSLGGAAPAGFSSLALAMLEKDSDAGKLFAAWSVLSAISQTILGPIIFTTLFTRTDSTLPESIFFLGSGLFFLSTILVSLVRIRHPHSLPALPPRPHTKASLLAQRLERHQHSQSHVDSSDQSASHNTDPMNSSRSRIRMRPPNVFSRQRGD